MWSRLQYFTKITHLQILSFLPIIILVIIAFKGTGSNIFLALASSMQTWGYLLIIINILTLRNVSGLSKHSLHAYSISFLLRSVLMSFFQGHAKLIRGSQQFFMILQWMKAVFCIYIAKCIRGKFRLSYDRESDKIQLWSLVVPAGLVSLVLHPSMNNNFIADVLWVFTHYLQIAALLPQLRLFIMKNMQISIVLSNFVMTLMCSRIFDILFWCQTYLDLNLAEHQQSFSLMKQYVGYWFLLCQLVHLGIGADFVYWFVRGVLAEPSISIPSTV